MIRRTSFFTSALAFAALQVCSTAPAITPQQEAELMRQYQAKQEMDRMEKEFTNPVKVDVPKDRAVLGDRNAPITIVEYSDFQCPYCKKGADTAAGLKKKYGKKMRLFFRHLPLDFHPQAMPAAKRFEAIALQNPKKAYEFHDKVFEGQSRLGTEGEKFLDEVAQGLKIDMKRMKKDMDGAKVKQRIDADMASARELGISGTPGFIVAGVTLKGAYPSEMFEQIIDRRLEEKEGKPKEEKQKEEKQKEEKKEEKKEETKVEKK